MSEELRPMVVLLLPIFEALGEAPERRHGDLNTRRNLMELVVTLWDSPVVDRPSFVAKLEEAGRLHRDPSRIVDRFAEFRAAAHLVRVRESFPSTFETLRFGETPDIELVMPDRAPPLGIEVKRARLRRQDRLDDEAMEKAVGRLVPIGGDNAQVQDYVEKLVFAKTESTMAAAGRASWLLFLASDSHNAVDDIIARCAVFRMYVADGHRPAGLHGVVFTGTGQSFFMPVLHRWEGAAPRDDIEPFLRRAFYNDPIEPLSATA